MTPLTDTILTPKMIWDYFGAINSCYFIFGLVMNKEYALLWAVLGLILGRTDIFRFVT